MKMRIKHRFTFNTDEKVLIYFLDKQKVNYDKGEILSVLEMFEDDENFKIINDFMVSHNAINTSEAIYAFEEIENAKWLSVRSCWMSQYPQPQDSYKTTTYDASEYCEGDLPKHICGKGLVQKDCFMLKKEPNWGSRHFMMLNWVWDELFISNKAEEVIKKSTLKGFEFYDVLSKSKKRLDGIKQIFVKTYVDKGFCDDSIKVKYVCPKCNSIKYISKAGSLRFHKEIFNDIEDDIVKTTDKFSGLSNISLILVTNKFYSLVKTERLDKGLVFEPVVLI